MIKFLVNILQQVINNEEEGQKVCRLLELVNPKFKHLMLIKQTHLGQDILIGQYRGRETFVYIKDLVNLYEELILPLMGDDLGFSVEDFYVEKMQRLTSRDVEANHSKADKFVLEFLTELGYTKMVEAYKNVEKWYA